MRDASAKGDTKISEGGRFANSESTFPKTGQGDYTEMKRVIEVTKFSGFGTARSGGDIFSGAPRAGKYMCHSGKMSNHNAKRHTVSTENQRRLLNRFLNRKVGWRLQKNIYEKENPVLVNKDEYFKYHLLLPFDSFVSHCKNVG